MTIIEYRGREYALSRGESVLDCLLRNGEKVSHSCRSGFCQSCILKGDGGSVPEAAQRGLQDTLKAQGYFLACSCYPENRLSISSSEGLRISAMVTSIEPLSDSVIRVRLLPEQRLEYRAGQYINLYREDGLARSYSLASLPLERELELHVRLVPQGAMSGWLNTGARAGTRVSVQGPLGNCFYVPGMPDQSLVLAGTGTGLAPLYGIARDALSKGHTGPVWLFHGGVRTSGLYLIAELRALAESYANFHYVPAVLEGEAPAGGQSGAIDRCILSVFSDLDGWRGYVCGDPAIVKKLRKDLFLAGIASSAIHTDAFTPSNTMAPGEAPSAVVSGDPSLHSVPAK